MDRLKKVINASGKMSILGVSTPDISVQKAMNYGASHFFEMKELNQLAGERIAALCGFDGAYVVSSASAGIVQSVAAVIAKNNTKLQAYPYSICNKRNIILPKGQNVDFGAPIETMVQIGGGIVVEAGYSNRCSKEDVAALIDENTAALMFVKSHHAIQKSMLSLSDMVAVAKAYDLPLIIDAAAEENFSIFHSLEFSYLIFSGAKAIEGPSSGIVFCTKESLEWILGQAKGLGRAMKIGKESVFGLIKAVENYVTSVPLTKTEQFNRIAYLEKGLSELVEIKVSSVQDESGREIYRARLYHKNCVWLSEELMKGNPAIYTRDYHKNEGMIDFDVRALNFEDIDCIVKKIKEIVQ